LTGHHLEPGALDKGKTRNLLEGSGPETQI